MILSDFIYEKYKTIFNGFFIEIGANDGITQSNTYMLEKNNNWNGMLIEPSSKWKNNLIENRKKSIIEECAVSNYNGKILGDFDGSLMSSVNGQRLSDRKNKLLEVNCFTLTELCKKNYIQNIDLCSIDVEGHEYEVIEGIDFNLLNIKAFVIEVYKNEEEKIFNFFKSKNYKINCVTNYTKETHPIWDGSHQDYLFEKL